MVEYDEAEAIETDRVYLTPEIARQRSCTLAALALRAGEHVLDAGCGTGLLALDIANVVGPAGKVIGVDISEPMLAFAERRCAGLAQATLKLGRIEQLDEPDGLFDAAACAQVLLYSADVPKALSELHRVVKPGGRVVIVETDWRGTVLHSADDGLTRRMLAAWDSVVPSPNLPVRLGGLLRDGGFSAIRVEAVPLVNTSRTPGGFSSGMLEQFAGHAVEEDKVTQAEAKSWLDDLRHKGDAGAYFFCVNRFLFSAVKA